MAEVTGSTDIVYLLRDGFTHANSSTMNRQSSFRGPVPTERSRNDKSHSGGDSEKGMWSSMLDSVASGKKLPEKNLVVLGQSDMGIEQSRD